MKAYPILKYMTTTIRVLQVVYILPYLSYIRDHSLVPLFRFMNQLRMNMIDTYKPRSTSYELCG